MITPELTVEELLRHRPLAVEIFEEWGLSFWDTAEWSLKELCRYHGISMEDLAARISEVPVPNGHTLWTDGPISHLLDYLRHQHRTHMHWLLSEISQLLDIQSIPDRKEASVLRKMRGAVRPLLGEFHEHMQRQECDLFARVLRTEACLRNEKVTLPHSGPSASLLIVKLQAGHKREQQQLQGLQVLAAELEQTWRAADTDEDIIGRLDSLTKIYREHGELERKFLYPWALNNEKLLYNLYISGARSSGAVDTSGNWLRA